MLRGRVGSMMVMSWFYVEGMNWFDVEGMSWFYDGDDELVL